MATETALSSAFQEAIQNSSKKKQVEFIKHQLYSQYPILRACLPLAIRIDQEMIAALPEVNQTLLRRVLSAHCKKPRYVKSIAQGGKRYSLDGKPSGVVNNSEQAFAKARLAILQPG